MAYREPERRWRGGDSAAISRLIVVAAILGVLIFAFWAVSTGAIHFFGSDDPPKAGPTPTHSSTAAKVAAPKTVQDGNFQYQVQNVVRDGAKKLVITVKVQNLSSSFASFYGENQLLIGSGNRTARGAVALTTLEPKEVAGVSVIFNVPSDFKVTQLELHSAPGSSGVRVSLS